HRHESGGHAARREQAHHAPFDSPAAVMGEYPAALGNGGVEQVGPHRYHRLHGEEENQDRRHERTAADAGHADDESDDEAGEGKAGFHGWGSGRRAGPSGPGGTLAERRLY